MEDLHLFYVINQDFDEMNDIRMQIPRRYIRDMENPMDFYSDMEFKRRFRFNKNTAVEILLPIILNDFEKINRRGLPIPPILCLCVALRFYCTGNFQLVSGDLRGFSQASVSRIVKKISILIARRLPVYIKFPEDEASKRENHRQFYDIAHFPQVTGCIDYTHVPIKSPGGDIAEVYRNRKRSFSINVQVVGGPNLQIFDIVARWPGRKHDSMIFNNSSVKARFENRTLRGFLLGDSGYPCMFYLMTPLRNTGNEPEERYNRSQIRTRNSVERLFGLWKRFPCLSKGLGNKLETVPAIIVACAVLHNIGLNHRDPFDEPEIAIQARVPEQIAPNNELPNVGHGVRRLLIQQHFS